MGSFGDKIRGSHTAIFQVLLFAVSVAFIVYLFPSKAAFKYEFSTDKPWRHETLFAPFEYAIKKTQAELEEEESQIRLNQNPYYLNNRQVVETQQAALTKSIQEDWGHCAFSLASGNALYKRLRKKAKSDKDSVLLSQHIKLGNQILASVFEEGIIDLDDSHSSAGSDFILIVLDGALAEEHEVSHFRTLQQAAASIRESILGQSGYDSGFLLDKIENALAYNIAFDREKTRLDIEGKLSTISLTRGKVWKGEKIIAKGEVVSGERELKLNSLKLSFEEQLGGSNEFYWITAGQSMLVAICMFTLALFLLMFRPEVMQGNRKLIFLLLLVILMTFLTRIAISFDFMSIYVVPFCLVPIILRAFYDTRLAIFVHLIISLIAAFLVPNQYEFVFIQILVGIVVSFSIVRMTRRVHFYLTAGVVFLCYSVAYTGFSVVQEGNITEVDPVLYAWFAGNALLSLFAYPLIYMVEKLFGFVSEVTLMELADTNSPLLRKLSAKAPGTFQHSLQVSNLAEAAIREIGGDALLIRTGALYHDVGKMKNPMYFIENQSGGTNPHNDLGYHESARVIVQHVLDGIELARKHNLPEIIIDFIRTHHGTTRTEFFYKMHLKEVEGDADTVDDTPFRYPGPLPSSKEMAVLMMADSVEAASKSLKSYNAESLSALVDSIIDHQMNTGQFVKAPITLKDITTIRSIFKRMLMNIYHVRVEYPE